LAVFGASLAAAALPAMAGDRAVRDRPGALDAEAPIACAQERGQPLGECVARVTHGEDGNSTVVVRFANGFSRSLHFQHGEFVKANATMSGSGSDTDWQRQNGVLRIRVDDQLYELPDTLLASR